MQTSTQYKGVKTTIPDNLLDPITKEKRPPVKSDKFGAKSLYYDGKYYFFEDIQATTFEPRILAGKPYEIQVVYHSRKWYQDTFFITEEFKNFLLKFQY